MTEVSENSRTSHTAGTISAIILATILVSGVGISALGTAYAEAVDKRGTTNQTVSGLMAQSAITTHTLSGQISSVQPDDDGNPSWIKSGIWVMRIFEEGDDLEPPRIQLVVRFAMVMPNGNALHSHSIYSFAASNYAVEDEGTTHTFEGTATVTMPDGPVSGVPVTVKVFNNVVVAMWIGPDVIDSHFGTGPVYGLLSSASQAMVERISIHDLDEEEEEDAVNGTVTSSGVTTSMVSYHDSTSGYLAHPEEIEGQLPAVVMIHEWWGLNENIKDMAEELAGEGYVVLAVDLYDGQVATEPSVAQTLAASVRENPGVAIENLNAAVGYVSDLENVDGTRVASLGWCFGGGFSLQLALNAEQPLAATVIYYGTPVTDEQELSSITWPVLGIFGAEDQSIPVETVDEFKAALDANDITNEIHIYEGVGHAFANPSGDAYAPEEAADAWEKTLDFLGEHV